MKSFVILIFLGLSLSVAALASTFQMSFEEFVQWEKKLKLNAKFHPQYKTPDYLLVGLWDSSPESAKSRYSFLKNNPQYAADYENIHKGNLSTQATDGSSLIKSKFEDMPPEIAEYYKKNPKDLLAAEGFNWCPVLARMLYTGQIEVPPNTSKSDYLQNHVWTPNGIQKKNNGLAYANTEYSGGYVRSKYDPNTGEIIDPQKGETKAPDEQVKKFLEALKLIQKDMVTVIAKAETARDSISISLKTSDNAPESIDCTSVQSGQFAGRCNELKILKKAYDDLNINAEKVKKVITGLDKTVSFPKIALDASALAAVINKSTKDPFASDKETPNCPAPLEEWKCLKTSITTLEGKNYNILLKWNRPLKKSKGTVFYGVGGTGTEESVVVDPSFKAEVDQLDQTDNVRFVYLLMLDQDTVNPISSGYWSHGGGYHSLAQVFMSIFELAVKKSLFHGNFLNYTGGSNGTMMVASAMSRYNVDAYFDRVVLHAGPFLPNLANACNKSSGSNFYLSSPPQVNIIEDYLSRWAFKDPTKKVCENQTPDHLSLLGTGLKSEYPNTRVHVIMGQKEISDGFGHWILASNKEWFDAIKAKSKERIVHPDLGHQYSYKDVQRLLKLGADE